MNRHRIVIVRWDGSSVLPPPTFASSSNASSSARRLMAYTQISRLPLGFRRPDQFAQRPPMPRMRNPHAPPNHSAIGSRQPRCAGRRRIGVNARNPLNRDPPFTLRLLAQSPSAIARHATCSGVSRDLRNPSQPSTRQMPPASLHQSILSLLSGIRTGRDAGRGEPASAHG